MNLLALGLFFLFVNQRDVFAQIDTSQCGKTSCCFLFPVGCSGGSCDILITFQYNKTSGNLDAEIGTRNTWVAFGLNSKKKMDGTKGEVCFKESSVAKLKAFSNSGTTPDFTHSMSDLTIKGNEIKNNFVICRYSRPIKPPGGSYMVDLNSKWLIVAAFGKSLTGANPGYHGSSTTSTSTSPSTIDLKTPCSITPATSSVNNVIAHGCLMIIAWVCFAASGMFIARYLKPIAGDRPCLGQKLWFQSHRIFMVIALTLTIISFIIIFVHKEGWSENVGAHPILGCIVTFLAILQPIMAAFRPHPEDEYRWVFNWAHRFVGSSALVIAAATIFLGLDLFQINTVVVIVWIVACVLFVILMEIGLFFIGNSSTSAEYNPSADKTDIHIQEDDRSVPFRKLMFVVAVLSFFGLGFAAVGLVAKKAK